MRDTGTDTVAEAFEEQRGRLVAVAYRMLGSHADAEDAVQEAWLRLSRQDADGIDNLAGWLTTVVGRICIDTLRTRRTHPESAAGELPEPVVTEDVDGPEEGAVLADSVGLALLVVLDTLRPDERLAFVLHDLFGVPFDEIAPVVDRSTDATKMLASRARRKVQGTPQPADRRRQREVVDAFLAASRAGDFDALLRVLDPDLRWTRHTSHGTIVKVGAEALAAQARRGADARFTARRVLVDGTPGLLAWGPTGRPLALMTCTVVGDRITEIVSFMDPKVLESIDLPAGDA
ncbi:sigma-70 family RNA polymerase sigma factor [Luteimicrobium sp. NPDC057192]|uniref:sigma-70 family RNA polymerase sigma factor n=1 Tax=Luteimicrobium sp. NPDC057192 TaxID=3346042 RepID=UPI0036451732